MSMLASSGSFRGSLTAPEGVTMGNEKLDMQNLNDRLASYLEKVKSLELTNSKLELEIVEMMKRKGPASSDYRHFEETIDGLRKKILEMTLNNSKLALKVDNARLEADNFQIKLEYELQMRQTIEADISALRKILDDTNVVRLHLESDIESLTTELIQLKKNHQQDVMELREQITTSAVQVDVDAPKGNDLAQIMEEMRAKYEKLALKNQEEIKAWHDSRVTEVQVQVIESTTALKEASSQVSETRRTMQSLEIELQSQITMKASLEAALRDLEMRYNMQMQQLNSIILQLEAELTQMRGNIQEQGQEYEALLNIKMKLEAEISTYRRLLDGEDFTLQDALEAQVKMTTKVKTVTETLVDGKVVSSSTDTKEL